MYLAGGSRNCYETSFSVMFRMQYFSISKSTAIYIFLSQNSKQCSHQVKTAANRKIFIDFSIQYLRKYNFDGLDLDWEYPCQRGGASSDKAGYVALVQVSI